MSSDLSINGSSSLDPYYATTSNSDNNSDTIGAADNQNSSSNSIEDIIDLSDDTPALTVADLLTQIENYTAPISVPVAPSVDDIVAKLKQLSTPPTDGSAALTPQEIYQQLKDFATPPAATPAVTVNSLLAKIQSLVNPATSVVNTDTSTPITPHKTTGDGYATYQVKPAGDTGPRPWADLLVSTNTLETDNANDLAKLQAGYELSAPQYITPNSIRVNYINV